MVEQKRDGEDHGPDEVPAGREVGRDEGHPDDKGGGHAHRNEPGLVEVVRQLPGLEGEHNAQTDQNKVVGEERDEPRERHVTGELHIFLRQYRLGFSSCWLVLNVDVNTDDNLVKNKE